MSAPVADVIRLIALGVPILCVDTCTVLDIMRDPTRKEIRPRERQSGLDLEQVQAVQERSGKGAKKAG